MSEEFNNFIEDIRESQEKSFLEEEQKRVNDILNEENISYSLSWNESMDLFTIKLQSIVGTSSAQIEISWPVDIIPAINDFLISKIKGVDSTISPESLSRFWLERYISEYEEEISRWVQNFQAQN